MGEVSINKLLFNLIVPGGFANSFCAFKMPILKNKRRIKICFIKMIPIEFNQLSIQKSQLPKLNLHYCKISFLSFIRSNPMVFISNKWLIKSFEMASISVWFFLQIILMLRFCRPKFGIRFQGSCNFTIPFIGGIYNFDDVF